MSFRVTGLIAGLTVGFLSLAVADRAFADFDQVKDSASLSQLIRSNAPHYWKYMKCQADLSGARGLLRFEGVVSGDPHMGNFSVAEVKTSRGKRQMKMVNVDFDDAGRAPLVLDFVRFVVSIKSFSEEIKKKELSDSYIEGLRGQAAAPPKVLRKLLDMSLQEYDQLVADYVEKDTTSSGFKLKPGKIEAYNLKISRAKIDSLFPGETVVDVAVRPRERGGSANAMRIWVLVEGKGGRRIMELKERVEPGVAQYQKQLTPMNWLAEVRGVFWPGLDGSTYELVDLDGTLFWLRQKTVGLIDIPYSSEKAKALDYVHELAVFDANFLGLMHGQQATSRAYLNAIEKDKDGFLQTVKELSKAYLGLANEAYKEKSKEKY